MARRYTGINARAVGVNGKRAAIIDWKSTQPEGWENDRRPTLKSAADMIIYEMHHRDFSSDSTSGVKNKGKYLALTERGTMNADKRLTGIDHLRELGITHVHLAFLLMIIAFRTNGDEVGRKPL